MTARARAKFKLDRSERVHTKFTLLHLVHARGAMRGLRALDLAKYLDLARAHARVCVHYARARGRNQARVLMITTAASRAQQLLGRSIHNRLYK